MTEQLPLPPAPTLPPPSCDCCPADTWALRQLPQRPWTPATFLPPLARRLGGMWAGTLRGGKCVCVCTHQRNLTPLPHMTIALPYLVRSMCVYLGLLLGFPHLHLVLE